MMMDKKGKIFGKISMFDIIVILAVIVCIAGVYVRFVARPQKVQVEKASFTYQVVVSGIRQLSVDTLIQSKGTKFTLAEKGRSDELGTLTDVTSTPSKETFIQKDGNAVTVDSPSKVEALLTLKLDGMVNDRGFFTPQLKDIGVGSTLILQNKYIKTEGQVVSIQ